MANAVPAARTNWVSAGHLIKRPRHQQESSCWQRKRCWAARWLRKVDALLPRKNSGWRCRDRLAGQGPKAKASARKLRFLRLLLRAKPKRLTSGWPVERRKDVAFC